MILRPPRSTRTDTLFPYTTLFRSYYASGTNILTKGTFTKWEDLAGVPVCGVQGTVYNRKLAEQYGAEIVAFKGAGEALTALKQSRCAAFVYAKDRKSTRLNSSH